MDSVIEESQRIAGIYSQIWLARSKETLRRDTEYGAGIYGAFGEFLDLIVSFRAGEEHALPKLRDLARTVHSEVTGPSRDTSAGRRDAAELAFSIIESNAPSFQRLDGPLELSGSQA